MNMRYFKNHETNDVHGYDNDYENDAPYIERCINDGWVEVTGNWPEPNIEGDA